MRWSSLFVPTGFLVSRRTSRVPSTLPFRLQESHLLRYAFPCISSMIVSKLCTSGSSNFARHYSQNRCYFLFLCLLRYFNSTGVASLRIHSLLECGFSHSDSSGSLLTYSSPKRFAVRRVLLRLLVPRHPLCALCSLTFFL